LRFLGGLALIVLGTAGCGGGGGSSSPSTPAPPASSCNGTSFTPNYVSSVDLLHWEVFPLRVFFVRDAQYTPTRQSRTLQGFDQWVTATRQATGGNGATYTVVSQQSQANVTVKFFEFTGGSGDTLGTTTVNYTPSDSVIHSAELDLGVTGQAATDIATAAHEFGHTLGISGHSPNQRDLMYFTGNSSGDVTTADLNTALTAYCGEFNTNAITKRTSEPMRTRVMH
jgi:predicted Zn-dependent protease